MRKAAAPQQSTALIQPKVVRHFPLSGHRGRLCSSFWWKSDTGGYLERAVQTLCDTGKKTDERLPPYLSPLGWAHIDPTSDSPWRSSAKIGADKLRPLRPVQTA